MDHSKPRFLEFFYFDAGGGHRTAATALKQVIVARYPNWHIEMINLQQLLEPADLVFRFTKVKSEDMYNEIVRRGWTWGSAAMLRGLQAGIRLHAPKIESLLCQHWQSSEPDLVVSLIPNFNRVMFRALKSVHCGVPYVTVMTDIADYPPHFWQEKQDAYLICGSDKATEQARSIGFRRDQLFQVSGMILKPSFYRVAEIDRRAEREKLGLTPDLPTALIMFGGNGSRVAVKIVEHLEASKFMVQSIVMCGRNAKLKQKLANRERCHAAGFVDNVPDYMGAADFFIGKPGPGSVSEALHVGLPVIVERNRRTMPQERPNTKWIEEHNLGLVIKSFRETKEAVRRLLDGNNLQTFQENAKRLKNRAVFEVPEIFAHIMDLHKSAPATSLCGRDTEGICHG